MKMEKFRARERNISCISNKCIGWKSYVGYLEREREIYRKIYKKIDQWIDG